MALILKGSFTPSLIIGEKFASGTLSGGHINVLESHINLIVIKALFSYLYSGSENTYYSNSSQFLIQQSEVDTLSVGPNFGGQIGAPISPAAIKILNSKLTVLAVNNLFRGSTIDTTASQIDQVSFKLEPGYEGVTQLGGVQSLDFSNNNIKTIQGDLPLVSSINLSNNRLTEMPRLAYQQPYLDLRGNKALALTRKRYGCGEYISRILFDSDCHGNWVNISGSVGSALQCEGPGCVNWNSCNAGCAAWTDCYLGAVVPNTPACKYLTKTPELTQSSSLAETPTIELPGTPSDSRSMSRLSNTPSGTESLAASASESLSVQVPPTPTHTRTLTRTPTSSVNVTLSESHQNTPSVSIAVVPNNTVALKHLVQTPVVVVVPATIAKATASAASVSAAASLVTFSASGATLASKNSMILGVLDCSNAQPYEPEAADWADSPTQLAIGKGKTRYLIGTLTGNTGIMMGCSVVLGAASLASSNSVRFPGSLAFPVLFLVTPTTTAATRLIRQGSKAEQVVGGGYLTVALGASVGLKFLLSTPRFGAEWKLGADKVGEWISVKDPQYIKQLGPLFADYRDGMQWFIAIDSSVAVASGVIDAFDDAPAGCASLIGAATALAGVYAASLAVSRPYADGREQYYALGTAATQFAALSVRASGEYTHAEASSWTNTWPAYAMTALQWVAIVKTGIDIANAIVRRLRPIGSPIDTGLTGPLLTTPV